MLSLSIIVVQGQNQGGKSPWVFKSKLGFHSGHVARQYHSVTASEGENMFSMYKVQRDLRGSHLTVPHSVYFLFLLPPAFENLPVQPKGPPGSPQLSIGPNSSTRPSSTEIPATRWKGTGFIETSQNVPLVWPDGPQCCLPF